MRGNPRRDPAGARQGNTRPPPLGRPRPGESNVNEGPTVEARVYGWKESRASAEECVSFLERKSRLRFKKVRLIIRVFIFALSSPSSAASFCGYTFSSSWRCFFVLLESIRVSGMVRDFWRLPRYYQRILIVVGPHGHEYKYPHALSKRQKLYKLPKKSRLLCENLESGNRRMMPMILQIRKPLPLPR